MSIHVNALMLDTFESSKSAVDLVCPIECLAGLGCTAPRCEKLHAKIQAARAEPRRS